MFRVSVNEGKYEVYGFDTHYTNGMKKLEIQNTLVDTETIYILHHMSSRVSIPFCFNKCFVFYSITIMRIHVFECRCH